MLKPFDSQKFAEDFNRVTHEGFIKTLRALFQEDQSIPKKEFLNRIATFFKENEIGVPSFVVPKIIDGFVSGMLHNGLLREEKDNYTIYSCQEREIIRTDPQTGRNCVIIDRAYQQLGTELDLLTLQ